MDTIDPNANISDIPFISDTALIELEKVMDSLGDRKSLSIFKYIAKQPSDTSTLRSQLNLSRKQVRY